MKHIIGIIFFILPLLSFGQQADTAQEDTTVYIFVEQMPEFPGGTPNLLKYINDNLRFRSDNVEDEICYVSMIVVEFIVEKDGGLSHIKIKKSACDKYADELIRVVKSMPKWKPGMQNGSPVRISYVIPIVR